MCYSMLILCNTCLVLTEVGDHFASIHKDLGSVSRVATKEKEKNKF